jgi:hypothetical protein
MRWPKLSWPATAESRGAPPLRATAIAARARAGESGGAAAAAESRSGGARSGGAKGFLCKSSGVSVGGRERKQNTVSLWRVSCNVYTTAGLCVLSMCNLQNNKLKRKMRRWDAL